VRSGRDAGTGDAALFNGTTTVALTSAQDDGGHHPDSINDGATIELPRIIEDCSIPGEFASGRAATSPSSWRRPPPGAELQPHRRRAPAAASSPTSSGFTMASTQRRLRRSATPRHSRWRHHRVHPRTQGSPTQEGHSVGTTFRRRYCVRTAPAARRGTQPGVRVVFQPPSSTDSPPAGRSGRTGSPGRLPSRTTSPSMRSSNAWSFAADGHVTPAPSFTAQTNPTVPAGLRAHAGGTLTLEVDRRRRRQDDGEVLLAPTSSRPAGQTGAPTDIRHFGG